MMAFNDTFYVLAVMMTCSIFLILIMRSHAHHAEEGVQKEIVLE
jgi:hypothetical protein